MSKNILITGAAGFIGGSILADFASRTTGPISPINITTVVRSQEQVPKLAKLGVNVAQVDLKDEQAVMEVVLRNEIDVVIHTAGAIDPSFAAHFIKALGKRHRDSGNDTHYFHSSVAAMFSEEGGWYPGQVNDIDPLYEPEKRLDGPNPVRQTHTLLTEQGKAQGVKTYIIALPCVYGTGTGEIKKLSVSIPLYVRTSIERKRVHRVEENSSPPAVHISDLVALYALMTTKVLQDELVPSGEQGYFIVMAHHIDWWEVMDSIAKHLSARGLVDGPEVHTWPSWEIAAKSLRLPPPFVKSITASSGNFGPTKAFKLGWTPEWTRDRFMNSIDNEIQATLDLDGDSLSVFDNLLDKE